MTRPVAAWPASPLTRLLGLEVPIIGAPFGPWTQVELAAAISRAGALGSLGTALRSVPELQAQWERLRTLTDGPWAINHTARPFDEEAFAASLQARPTAISFHLAVVPELIARAHDAGILWIQQVMDRSQAEQALAAGVDVLIAQGGEAGGNGGDVSTMVLVPQVVALAGEVPVVAAGGIATGRGLAAALALGAQGVSMGTRFLACEEMAVAGAWKQRIVDAEAGDAVKVVGSERVLPPFTLPGPGATPRALRTPLTEALAHAPQSVDAAAVAARLRQELREGGGHEDLPFTGQSAGLISAVLPAAEIIARVLGEAAEVLRGLPRP